MSDNGGEFFVGFLVGALAGAAAALLFAPSSGQDLRKQIGDKGIEIKGQATKLADDARLQAQRTMDEARGQAEEFQQRGRIVLSENVKKAQQAVQEAQARLAKTEGEAS